MDKRLYLENGEILGTSLVDAAGYILVKYLGGIDTGAAVYKKLTQFKSVIKTEEDQLEYIKNLADDVLETYPIYYKFTGNIINNHKRKFVKHILRCRMEDSLFAHITKLMQNY